jgi:hypothetical protein
MSDILGNNIFDAIQGAPGTFLYLDSHGNLGFGFSSVRWAATLDLIDSVRNSDERSMVGAYSPAPVLDDKGNPILITPDQRPPLGEYPSNVFGALVKDWGTYQVESGLLADLATAATNVNDLSQRDLELSDRILREVAMTGIDDTNLEQQLTTLNNQLNVAVNEMYTVKSEIWLMTLGWPVNKDTMSEMNAP